MRSPAAVFIAAAATTLAALALAPASAPSVAASATYPGNCSVLQDTYDTCVDNTLTSAGGQVADTAEAYCNDGLTDYKYYSCLCTTYDALVLLTNSCASDSTDITLRKQSAASYCSAASGLASSSGATSTGSSTTTATAAATSSTTTSTTGSAASSSSSSSSKSTGAAAPAGRPDGALDLARLTAVPALLAALAAAAWL
ncbi:hypothetical protein HK405_005875, partial [Cladochytrium tenue]